MTLVGALALGTASAATLYQDLLSKFNAMDVTGLVIGGQPSPPADPSDPFKDRAVNLLVMGTDLRDEANAAIAGEGEGMRSDTTMLVHISADRRWIEVVSIPRDSTVRIPACNVPDGGLSRPQTGRFNSAFSIGGGTQEDLAHAAACTITAVQDLTGVTVTNHAVVKMNGIVDVVNAIGGVRMCLPEPMVQTEGGNLRLDAGDQVLHGELAIAYLRARKGHGMGLELGSDLARIERQQAFISATMRQILSAETLADPGKMYGLVSAALSALSADPQLADPQALVGLGWSLRGLGSADVVMTQLPVVPDPGDPENRVVWGDGADEIWQRLADDTPPPGHEAAVTVPAGGGEQPPGTTTEPGSGGQDTSGGVGQGGAGQGTTEPAAPAPEPSPSREVLLDGVCA